MVSSRVDQSIDVVPYTQRRTCRLQHVTVKAVSRLC